MAGSKAQRLSALRATSRQGSAEGQEEPTSDGMKKPRKAKTRGLPITTNYPVGTRAEDMTAGNRIVFLSRHMVTAVVQPNIPELPFASPNERPEWKEQPKPVMKVAMTKGRPGYAEQLYADSKD
jgi:hypothetical protein